jgi:hypothetical protein
MIPTDRICSECGKEIKGLPGDFCSHPCEIKFNYNVGKMSGEAEAYSKVIKDLIEQIKRTPMEQSTRDYLIWCIKYDFKEETPL